MPLSNINQMYAFIYSMSIDALATLNHEDKLIHAPGQTQQKGTIQRGRSYSYLQLWLLNSNLATILSLSVTFEIY